MAHLADNLNITYLSTDNPDDIHGWSGLTHNIARSLANAGNHMEYIHSFSAKRELILKIKQKLYPKLTGKFIQPNRYPSVYKQYNAQIHAKLDLLPRPDFIFSNSSEIIAALDTDIPMAMWLDAGFAAMIGYYPEFNQLHPETIRKANQLEQLAFDKAKYIFFASEWAAKTAIEHYKIALEKVKVVPFGANINHKNTKEDIQHILGNKSTAICKLLFIGVYWERKGGDIALKIVEGLNKSGIKTELTVVGCTPFDKANKPDFVIQEGFLSKKDPEQLRKLEQLFKESHFLIVPSKAECYGLVYCEANSYGLPAIGTNTGGIPTILKDDKNGRIFEPDCPIDEYISFINHYFTNQTLYGKLSLSSFNEYATRLNWKIAGETVTKILRGA